MSIITPLVIVKREGSSRGSPGPRTEIGRTLVLFVERAVATPPAEGVGLGVPLTVRVEDSDEMRK